ncbi:GMC oxidoreductase-domain-containing protein [Mycena galericulata]|nr:GMC oxidoreductase-domain-containing protein [Mycena galericulata]
MPQQVLVACLADAHMTSAVMFAPCEIRLHYRRWWDRRFCLGGQCAEYVVARLFKTTSQAGANNRSLAAPRGKMVGGSSGLNLLAWNRATQVEYDVWAAFSRSPIWSWAGLTNYFAKSQTVEQGQANPFPGVSLEQYTASFTHGGKGPIKAHDFFIEASYNELYADIIQTNGDPDSGSTIGIYNTRMSIDRSQGIRSYAANEYFAESCDRSNLHIITGAQVTRVLLEETSSRRYQAMGVAYTVASESYIATTSKEVILSAGSVQTPQLLELSGKFLHNLSSGNVTLLKSLGITPLIDLPEVGENMQEYVFSLVEFELNAGHQTFHELANNATFLAEQTALYPHPTEPPVINGNYLNNDFGAVPVFSRPFNTCNPSLVLDVQTILQILLCIRWIRNTLTVNYFIRKALDKTHPGSFQTGSHIMGTAALATQEHGGMAHPLLQIRYPQPKSGLLTRASYHSQSRLTYNPLYMPSQRRSMATPRGHNPWQPPPTSIKACQEFSTTAPLHQTVRFQNQESQLLSIYNTVVFEVLRRMNDLQKASPTLTELKVQKNCQPITKHPPYASWPLSEGDQLAAIYGVALREPPVMQWRIETALHTFLVRIGNPIERGRDWAIYMQSRTNKDDCIGELMWNSTSFTDESLLRAMERVMEFMERYTEYETEMEEKTSAAGWREEILLRQIGQRGIPGGFALPDVVVKRHNSMPFRIQIMGVQRPFEIFWMFVTHWNTFTVTLKIPPNNTITYFETLTRRPEDGTLERRLTDGSIVFGGPGYTRVDPPTTLRPSQSNNLSAVCALLGMEAIAGLTLGGPETPKRLGNSSLRYNQIRHKTLRLKTHPDEYHWAVSDKKKVDIRNFGDCVGDGGLRHTVHALRVNYQLSSMKHVSFEKKLAISLRTEATGLGTRGNNFKVPLNGFQAFEAAMLHNGTPEWNST